VPRDHLQLQILQSNDLPCSQTLDPMLLFTVTVPDQVEVIPTEVGAKILP
jgi:hypothetical protein